jgi:hypothetical protein
MEKISIDTNETPKITLDVKGNLTVKGWPNTEVIAASHSKVDLKVEEVGDEIQITCYRDCTVKVPYWATLNNVIVSGNGSIKSVEGSLNVEAVYGNLTLRSVGSSTLGVVHGNLVAKNISGDLHLHAVRGNANVTDVQGDFVVEDTITSNLKLSDVDNNASASARGNATIYLDPSPGHTYSFESNGNLSCYIPSDASTNVEISRAAKISIKLPDIVPPSPVNAPYSFSLGDGDANLSLSAGGNVNLRGQSRDWDMDGFDLDIEKDLDEFSLEIEEQVLQQMEAHMELMEADLEIQMANITTSLEMSGISAEKASKIAEKTRIATERANQRAQEKMKRAQEKMQRKVEAARRRAEMKARSAERAARDRRRRPESSQWTPPKPAPAQEPVSDAERLMVLEMLEQSKITMDEAEQLLAALEGNSE